MENNSYQVYEEAVIQLAESLVLKSVETASGINQQMLEQHGPGLFDPADPTTWKFYLNVSGQYHSTDTLMTVVSLDTLQTIEFSRQNLQDHRSTAKNYAYGSKLYKELVERYPSQERLILGILYPCDIDFAINSPEGTILSYPPHLVESYEYSLIPRVQEWIYAYMGRWYNQQYVLSDDLYMASVYMVLFANLIPVIMGVRLELAKTNQVHSFHLRQHLASNGGLDVYLTYLTRKQALWLYRNIAYIKRNNGKQAVFEWLTEHIMTERGLPLAAYEMRHNLEGMPANLTPVVEFEKLPLNTEQNHDGRTEFSMNEIFDKEDPLAKDNVRYRDTEQASAQKKMGYSLSNELTTKLLESSIIDYAGSEYYRLADIMLYHWLELSATGHYRAVINVVSPVNGETISLRADEAFAFYVYASCAVIGNTLEELPIVSSWRVIRTPKPSLADIMSKTNPARVTAAFAAEMLNTLPVPQAMISVESFYEYCVELHKAALRQYKLATADEGIDNRAQKFICMDRCWKDRGIQLGTEGQNYTDWFAERNIRIAEFKPSDLAAISVDLLEAATGVNSSSAVTLKDIQQAMVRLMAQLSSYTVQYTSNINAGPITQVPAHSMRYDNYRGKSSGNQKITTVVSPIKSRGRGKAHHDYEILGEGIDFNLRVKQGQKHSYDPTVDIRFGKTGVALRRKVTMACRISAKLPPIANNPDNVTQVLGTKEYLELTQEQRDSIPDAWLADSFN